MNDGPASAGPSSTFSVVAKDDDDKVVADARVNYVSSDENVASLKGAVLTAKKEGTVVVTARASNAKADCSVTVTA